MLLRVSIVSWPFMVCIGGISIIFLLGSRVVRVRNTYAIIRLALLTLALIVAAADVADGVNAYYGYLPRLGDVLSTVQGNSYWPTYGSISKLSAVEASEQYPNGVTARLPVPDRGSGFGPREALVWLPHAYFAHPSQRFPVAYLIHGTPGSPADWFRGGQAAQTALRLADIGDPIILVAPRMSQHWGEDSECVDGVREPSAAHLFTDVIPTVDSTLRTISDRAGRIVGGYSAGGYCALNLGLRHRSAFSAIIDLSGETYLTHSGGARSLFGSGPKAAARVRRNSPAQYARELPIRPVTYVWFDCGTQDQRVRSEMRAILPALRHRGIKAELHIRPGGHDFYVWSQALKAALRWGTDLLDGPRHVTRP